MKRTTANYHSNTMDRSKPIACAFCFIRIGISEQHIRKDDNAYHQGCYVKAHSKIRAARQ